MKKNTLIVVFLFFFPFFVFSQTTKHKTEANPDFSEVLFDKYDSLDFPHALQKQTGATDKDIKDFSLFYQDTLWNHKNKFILSHSKTNNVNRIELSGIYKKDLSYYVSLYNTFQQIKKEYPSSVNEILHHPHGPTLPACDNTPCDNLGFENGNLSGWTGGYCQNTGNATTGGFTAFTMTGPLGAVTTAIPDPTVTKQHPATTNMLQIMSGAGIDPISGLPVVCPGAGNYSCRIGDTTVPGSQVAILENTFIVTPSTCDFTYFYSVILQNPTGHTQYDLPFFTLYMFDQNGDTIPHCGNYTVIANGAASQGFDSLQYNGAETFYSQWKSAFVPLKKYIGQCVSIMVEVSDCGPGGHFGYAYFDATCSPLNILTSAPVVCGKPITLTAPTAASYQWTGPCIIGPTNTQTITVGCAGKYSVVLLSIISATCGDTLDTVIAGSTANPPVPNFKSDTVCLGNPTQFTNLTTGGAANNTYNWNFGQGGAVSSDSSHVTNPVFTYTAVGTYTATLQALNSGCGGDTSFPVVVIGPPTAAFTANSVCLNTPTKFTNTSTGSTVYSWKFGDGGTSTAANPTHTYPACGTYTATLYVGIKGCIDSAKQTINVNANPVPKFTSDTVCVGKVTNFTDQTTIACGGKVTGWSWKFGDPPTNGTSTVQNPAYTYGSTGTYNVTLTATSDSGCTAAVTLPALVSPNPVASFTSGPVCLGQATTFTSTSTGTPTKFTWSFGDGSPNGSGAVVTHTYPSAGTFTVKLTVSSGAGCVDSTTNPVTVNPIPTSGFTADTVCQGTATAFKDTSTGGTSWAWKFGDPANGTATGQTPTYTYAAAGTYNVTEIVTSANGCKDSITLPVLVNPNPTGTFTVPPVCLGSPSVFTLTTSIPVATYAWTFGDPANGTSAVQNPSYTYATTGTFNVTVVLTTAAGCTGTAKGTAVVNPIPVANFVAPAVCQDQAMKFTSTSTVASGTISTYVWNFGDGGTSALPNPTHQYAKCGTYNVMLTVTSAANCMHDTTIAVIINPMPIPSFTGTNVCQGLTTAFTDASTIGCGDSIIGWSWSFGDGTPPSTLQNPTHTYAKANIYSVTETVTSSNGCDSMITLPVTVYPLPVPKFTAPPVCQGTPTTFTDGSTVAGGFIKTWLWNFGDGKGTSTKQDPSYTYAKAGTYTVSLIVTSDHGCIDSTTKVITVNPNPVPGFGPDTSACVPLCITFKDTSKVAPPSIISSWLWNFGDGSSDSSSVLPNPTHCFRTVGTFTGTLTVTTNNGCSATFVNPNYVTTWPIPVAKFTASPNPTVLVNNPTVTFIDQSTGNPVSWTWTTFGDPSDSIKYTQNTTHTYTDTGTFVVQLDIVNKYGCKDSVTLPVVVQPVWTFYVPNAFTPNGDGLNDGFIGKGVGILKYEMWIFDRWGMLLYHCTDMQHPWNGTVQGTSGKECQEDTYVWLIEITDVFHAQHRYVGRVSLIK